MVGEQFKNKGSVVRLWIHECERVLSDRLINDNDIAKFDELRINVTRKFFDDIAQVSVFTLSFSILWRVHGYTFSYAIYATRNKNV